MRFQTTLSFSALATGVAVAMALAGPAPAAQDFAFDGSKVRVNLSSKLKMLGQQISAAGCAVNAGINEDLAKAALSAAQRDFETILDGLEDGDLALGIPTAETHSVVIKSLREVREAWAPIDAAASSILSGGDAAAASATIADGDVALEDATDILVSDVLNTYSNPHEMTQSQALTLKFSGRQRMLTYKISKSLCGIATGVGEYGTVDALAEHANMYELSLGALQNGMSAVGINPPPNDLIAGELAAVAEDWAGIKPALATALQSSSANAEQVVHFGDLADQIVLDMSNVVTLYMLAAPESERVYLVALEAYARDELSKWLDQPALINAVLAQNAAHEGLTQDEIDALDLTWRAEAKAGGGDLIETLLEGPASAWLRENQDATAGFVTEVFAMDNKGLNVAQSVETSDYWQGDEAKWKQTFGNGSGDTHISEVELDASTGAYQTQVSLPLRHPDTNELIGAITFGINVQSLL